MHLPQQTTQCLDSNHSRYLLVVNVSDPFLQTLPPIITHLISNSIILANVILSVLVSFTSICLYVCVTMSPLSMMIILATAKPNNPQVHCLEIQHDLDNICPFKLQFKIQIQSTIFAVEGIDCFCFFK